MSLRANGWTLQLECASRVICLSPAPLNLIVMPHLILMSHPRSDATPPNFDGGIKPSHSTVRPEMLAEVVEIAWANADWVCISWGLGGDV